MSSSSPSRSDALVLFGVCFTILLTVYLLNKKFLTRLGGT